MNRKFRGKRKDNGERVYGSLTICNAFDLNDGIHKPNPLRTIICKQDVEWISEPNNKRWTFPSYEVIPETVGQSTGLCDKNGKEIYEGDILATPDDKRAVPNVIVKFGDTFEIMKDGEGYYGWYCEYVKEINGFKACQLNSAIEHTSEVIGNIHESPKLLEQEK